MPGKKGPASFLKALHNKSIDMACKGEWLKGSKSFDRLRKQALEATDERMYLEATLGYGDCETQRGHFRLAVDAYTNALDRAEEMGDYNAKALALRGLGYVHWRKSDCHMALEYLSMALALLSSDKDSAFIGRTHIDIGNVYSDLMNPDLSEDHYTKGIELLSKVDGEAAQHDLIRAYNNLGSLYNLQGHYSKGIEYLEGCIDLCVDGHDDIIRAWAMTNLAYSYSNLNEFDKAYMNLEEARSILNENDDRVGHMITYHILGTLKYREGKIAEAKKAFDTSIRKGRSLGLPGQTALVLKDYGIFLCETGHKQEGLEALWEATDIYNETRSAFVHQTMDLLKRYGGKGWMATRK